VTTSYSHTGERADEKQDASTKQKNQEDLSLLLVLSACFFQKKKKKKREGGRVPRFSTQGEKEKERPTENVDNEGGFKTIFEKGVLAKRVKTYAIRNRPGQPAQVQPRNSYASLK